MKKLITAAVVAALTAAGVGMGAGAASAVASNVVTPSEFAKVTQGNSLDYVRKVFGTNGTVVYKSDKSGYKYDNATVEFKTASSYGFVRTYLVKNSKGTWILDTKAAAWGIDATRTSNKATPTEFGKLTQGNSLDYVRKTFGTNGTVTFNFDAPGYSNDSAHVEWPTTEKYGSVEIYVVKNSKGAWVLSSKSANWDVDPTTTSNKATKTEFNKVKTGNSLDYVRKTFGTSGTILAAYDAAGYKYDRVSIIWDNGTSYGAAEVDFVRNSKGAWVVKESYWSGT